MEEQRHPVIPWLLDSDPSIRWQVQRDLLDAPRRVWHAERAKLATEGWGARILSLQDRSGTWGGGIYSPKWVSTTYTLLQLREMGLPPDHKQAQRGCDMLLRRALGQEHNRNKLRDLATAGCTCMMGMWLAVPAYFGIESPRLDALVERILDQQMHDGGWNCRLRNGKGAKHSSFHTTFNVLDGVREAIDRKIGPAKKLRDAQGRAIEFMLMHRMYKSDRTGKIIKDVFTKLSFPFRWHYDILRGLDFISTTDAIHDKRLDDVFQLLLSKRQPDGTWKLEQRYAGKEHFHMESLGKPSRWNTLRALRCLKARRAPVQPVD